VQAVASRQLLATEHLTSLRVTQKGGYRFVLDSPRISGDSLVGAANGQPSGVPLVSIAELESRQSDGIKSVGLGVGVAAALALVFFGAVVMAMSSGS